MTDGAPDRGFSVLAQEALGWYVYLLVDVRDGQVFYVGKGRGNRAYAHEAYAVDVADSPELQSAKHQRILQIRAEGGEVRIEVLRHGIETEKAAYLVESAAIDLAERLQPGVLLNVVLGHHHAQRGWMTAEQIEVLYAAPAAPEPTFSIMLVSLNQVWTPLMSEAALLSRTTGWWRAGGVLHRRPEYLMGVHNGVVRSVYRPVNWRTADDDRQRWGCDGQPAPEMSHWLRTNVKRYLTAKQWAIRYIGPPA